ncbi:MAG: hypothetical protein M3R13_00580 [Armatimonadota bacterium]|nr:hypothetical protein [Armatimonadota bacterium]
MERFRHTLAVMAAAALSLTVAGAEELLNPSFEVNQLGIPGPFNGYRNVFDAWFYGTWGAENGLIVTGTQPGSVVPNHGRRMLQVWDDGGTHTQTIQIIEVPFIYWVMIDTNKGSFQLRALYNSTAPAAVAVVTARLLTAPQTQSPATSAQLTLDNNPSTWQNIKRQGDIPPGTRWIIAEVAFTGPSLGAHPGYVDLVTFEFIHK